MTGSFYWHDYETFGTDPSRDRPVQFAGLRTDSQLNIIGEPLVLFARPSADVLPQPDACMVTGISPQQALREGVPEAEFIARILAELGKPGTCGVGYNSLRFDDEVTRYTLYRNFHDPYAREYRDGNSRWDIIDMVRLTHALRPEGINWPLREDGLPSFRLEDLTQANGISHASAHDALSDVEATIAVARLIRERQPRLFDYVLNGRGKEAVLAQLNVRAMKPVLHVSGMFGAKRHSIALIAPIAQHPGNRNEIICYDLAADPDSIEGLDAETMAARLFSPSADLPEGVERPGIKTVRANRCPVLVTPKFLDAVTAQRLGINVELCLANLERIKRMPGLVESLRKIYQDRRLPAITDPDRMLYSGGFFSSADRSTMDRVVAASPDQLRDERFVFEDKRLPELLFRYRARNFPDSLSPDEQAQWQEYCFAHLTDPDAGASICMEEYQSRIDALLQDPSLSESKRELLRSLLDYGDQLLG